MRRQLTTIVSSILLVLLWFAYDGTAASIFDPLLNPLRDYLVNAATRYLSRAINGSIEVGALRGSLFSTPVLQQVVVRDAEGEAVARIEEIRLSYELTSLIRGSLQVNTIEIVRPWLRIVEEPDGVLNISKLLSVPQAENTDAPDPPEVVQPEETSGRFGLPFALVIERLQVHEGNAELEVPALPGVRAVEGLEARLSGELEAQRLQAQLQQVTAHLTPADLSLKQAQGGLEILAGKVQIDDLRLELGDTLLTAAGVVPWSPQPTSFELYLQPLDMEEIGRLLHNDALHGQVRLTAKAEGPPEALVVSADLGTNGARVELQGEVNRVSTPPSYRATLNAAKLDLAAVIRRAMLQSDLNLHARVDGTGLSLKAWRGEAQLDIEPSHLGNIALHPSQIHLVAQQQRFEVQRFDLNTSVARMTAGGVLDLAGRSDLQYELIAELADLQPLLDMQALAGHLQLQGRASGDWPALATHGTLEARDLRYQDHRVQTLQLTYEGSQLGSQPNVETHLVARQLQAGSLPVEQVGLEAAYRGAAAEVRFAADVVHSPHAGGNANGTVALIDQGQRVVVEELVVRLPDRTWRAPEPLRVTHQQQRLAFEQVRLVHDDETIELSGAIEGEQLQDLRLRALQIDLTYLQRLLGLPDAVAGRASLEAQLEGTFEDPILQSELRLLEGAPQQLPFEQLQATLAYVQQHLRANVRIQQMDRPVLALELNLPVELALTALPWPQRLVDAPLALSVEVKQPRLAPFHRWQPALPPLTGTLQGTLGVQGTYATLALDADMQLQELGVGDLATQIEAPVHLTAEMVTAESVQALVQALQQGQMTPTLQEVVLRVPRLEGQLSDQIDAPQPFRVRDLILRANGQWSAEGLRATLQNLELQAQAFGMPPAELSMAAQLTPQLLELTTLQVRLAQSEVYGQGQLVLPSQELQFRLEIPRLQLDILPLELPPNLPSAVQGVVAVDGTAQAPQVQARLRYAGAQIHAALGAQLQKPLPSYNATVRIDGFNVATLLPEGRGKLNARLQLQGEGFTAEQRHADLDLTINTSNFTLAPGLTARLQANLAGDVIRLEDFRLRSIPVDVVASGTLSAAQRAELTYTVILGDLTALESQLGVALQARGTLSGTVEGPLDSLQTQGRLQMTDWRYAALSGQRLQAEFFAEQLPAAPQATLQSHLVGVQGPSLPASEVHLAANYSSSQGNFTVTVTQGPYENTMLAGSALLDDGQHLTLRRLHVQRGDLVWQNHGPIEVVRGPQGMIELQRLVLRSGTQEISARGRLDPKGPMRGEVRVSQLQIQPTMQAVAPDTSAPEGRLSLDLRLDGTLDQPRALGSVEVSALAWQDHALGEIRADLELRNQVLRTDLRWRFQEQEILQVRGTVGLSPDDRLALQAQAAAIDLALLEPLSPAITHSSGTLRLELEVTGRLQQPQVYGSLQLSEGALQLAPTGERYRNLEARLSFAGDRIDIERLHVGSRSGPLQLTGRIEHSGLALERVDLVMRAAEFTAVSTPAIQTVISGDIAVRGSLQEMLATGSVTVPRGRVILDELPWGGPREVQPWELTVPGVYGPGPEAVSVTDDKAPATALGPAFSLPFLRADLAIAVPQNFWVQAPRTAVELSGELRVTKELYESFALSGSIDTVRGYASYYGKKFEIEEGHVIFTGSGDINPHLDITVTHAVAGYVISIHLGGTIREPAISFSSTPELPETDIISLLVIGKTSDRLTSSEQSALTSQLQQVAGGLVAARLEQAIGERLGLDIIEITPGETLGTGMIGAGRYITQNLFVSIGQQFAGGGFRISLEYSITPQLKLELSSRDPEGTAVDFLWRRDY